MLAQGLGTEAATAFKSALLKCRSKYPQRLAVLGEETGREMCFGAESQRGLLAQAQGWRLPRPELTCGTDEILPLTSSQSLNLSNLTLWFVFLFKVGVIVLVAAVCLRCAGISGLNLVKTRQAEVGHKCSKSAAVTEIPSRSNPLVTHPQHRSALDRAFQSLNSGRQNNTPILEASKSY